MALAAFGCDPTQKGKKLSDIGGAALGQLAFSTENGIYMAIRANGSVAQYETCFINAGFDATPNATTNRNRGVPICIPQVALSDDDYGWGLVYGVGRVRTDGAVTSNSGLALSSTDQELDTAASTLNVISGLVAFGADGAHDGPVFAMFPAVAGGVS